MVTTDEERTPRGHCNLGLLCYWFVCSPPQHAPHYQLGLQRDSPRMGPRSPDTQSKLLLTATRFLLSADLVLDGILKGGGAHTRVLTHTCAHTHHHLRIGAGPVQKPRGSWIPRQPTCKGPRICQRKTSTFLILPSA